MCMSHTQCVRVERFGPGLPDADCREILKIA